MGGKHNENSTIDCLINNFNESTDTDPVMIGPVRCDLVRSGLVRLVICSFILEASHISAVFHAIFSSSFSFSFSIGVESLLVCMTQCISSCPSVDPLRQFSQHYKSEHQKRPSLWPSGIGSRLGRNRLWVRFLAVSDIYSMFIEPTITWVPSGLRVYMAWHKNCVKKLHVNKQVSEYVHYTILKAVQMNVEFTFLEWSNLYSWPLWGYSWIVNLSTTCLGESLTYLWSFNSVSWKLCECTSNVRFWVDNPLFPTLALGER